MERRLLWFRTVSAHIDYSSLLETKLPCDFLCLNESSFKNSLSFVSLVSFSQEAPSELET